MFRQSADAPDFETMVARLDTQWRPYLVGLRHKRGLTQAQVASRMGISQQSYARLEKAPWNASVRRLGKAFLVLGATLAVVPKDTGAPEENLPW